MAGLFPVEECFQEAKGTSWDQSLWGYVESVDGAPGGQLVIVEWVAAIRPNPAQRSGLKQIGARRDPNGVWWARKSTVTDESGLFSLDGLPNVQLRVRAAGEVRNSRPGSFLSFRAGNP